MIERDITQVLREAWDKMDHEELEKRAWAKQGVVSRKFDKEEDMYDGEGPREGLEGPFRSKAGFIYYYDPKEGAYYNPKSDMYIQDDELQSMGIMEAKRKFTVKGDEIADKVAQGYVDKGMDPEKAKSIGYATVTKNNPKERIG